MSSGIESDLSNVYMAPPVGRDFPYQPMPGYLIVKVIDPDHISSKTGLVVPERARKREMEHMAREASMPLTGTVIVIGVGIDKDPDDGRRKPLPIEEGDHFYGEGDVVLFSPAAGYILKVLGDDSYRLIGDRDIMGIKAKSAS